MKPQTVDLRVDTPKFQKAMRRASDQAALFAWRLDAFATDVRDERLLSSPVLDAFRGTVRP